MKSTGYGLQIIAKLIVDHSFGTSYDNEVEATRKALERWLTRPSQLWTGKKAIKRDRYLARLERRMMGQATCRREILTRHRARLIDDLGQRLAAFFYGDSINGEELRHLQIQAQGIRGSILAGSKGNGHNWSATSRYHYFHFISGKNYMLAHDFELFLTRDSRQYYLTNRRSGFAFPAVDGSVHRMLIDTEHTGRRIFDSIATPLRPSEMPKWFPSVVVHNYAELEFQTKHAGFAYNIILEYGETPKEYLTNPGYYPPEMQELIQNLIEDVPL